jgi:uncharacterized protein YdaU (DUF1376 family)
MPAAAIPILDPPRSLPDDDAQLARIVGMTPSKWRRVRPIIQAFFEPGWKHKALDEQIEDAGTRREKARKAAEARWNEAA